MHPIVGSLVLGPHQTLVNYRQQCILHGLIDGLSIPTAFSLQILRFHIAVLMQVVGSFASLHQPRIAAACMIVGRSPEYQSDWSAALRTFRIFGRLGGYLTMSLVES